MTTKTFVLTGGTSFTPTGDMIGATAAIICWGAGENGQSASESCGVASTGDGGTSGCVAWLNSFTFGSSAISMQIPAGGSTAACWFNSPSTVQASSQTTSTAGCVGSGAIGGSPGGSGFGYNPCVGQPGGGGGGAPGPTSGGAAGDGGNTDGVGGAGGGPGYALTAGGSAGPGNGGNGGPNGNDPGNPAGGPYSDNFGGGGGGGGVSIAGGCCGGGFNLSSGGPGEQGGIVIVYTPYVAPPKKSDGSAFPMLGM